MQQLMMVLRRHWAHNATYATLIGLLLGLGALAFGSASSPAHAQSSGVVDQLLAQARAWQAKGRMDKAIEAWKKVLLSQPNNAEALEAVGLWHANAGHGKQANEMLAALERVAPGSQGVGRLRAALRVGKDFDARVQDARVKVRAGKLAEAAAAYEQAFSGAAPPERLAVEYYQTLGGTEGGWERARAGLDEFVKKHPDQVQARLALAQHLTYHEETRRDGIDQLRALAAQPALREQAVAAWHKALLWLRATAADAPRLRAYLDEVAADEELADRLKTLTAHTGSNQRGDKVQAGFDALERQDIDEASRQFARAGDAPEALVGLALIAMRKEDFELATKLLEKASASAPSRSDLWKGPLRSARFWQRVKKAAKLTESKDYAAAEGLLREAIEISPEEAFNARVALADMFRKSGRLDSAEEELDRALTAQPDQPALLRALIDVRLSRENYEGALESNARLAVLDADKAYPQAWLNGEVLRQRAKKRRAAGELTEALALLQEAVQLSPKSYWATYDLGSLQLELGDFAAAHETLQRLLAIDARAPAGRAMHARLLAEEGRPEAALEMLETMPGEGANGDVGKLRQILELKRDVDRVVRTSARLGPFGARREMLRLQRKVGGDPELIGIVALGWADVGDAGRGIELITDLLSNRTQPDPGLSLLLAAIYLRAGMDDELKQLLEELASEPSLSPRARRDLSRLHVAYAVATSDKLAAQGEFSRAFALLEPLLSEYPNDPALMSGLGRLSLHQGNYAEASAAFEQVLRRHPDHVEAREGAVSAAQARGDLTRASELVEQGLARSPNHARMHLIAAHYELAQDDDAAAMQALDRARSLAAKSEPAGGAAKRKTGDLLPSDSAGLLAHARANLGSNGEAMPAAESKALMHSIDDEIEVIRARHSVHLRIEPEFRYRQGEKGIGQVIEADVPFWLSVPLGYFGRIEVGASAVWLSAGTAPLDDINVAKRFGALGSVPGTSLPRPQDDAGIAPQLAFLYKNVLRFSLGTTPLGFIYRDLVGSLRIGGRWGNFALTVQAERAPVTDSLLSYAGTTDPLTGKTWGGVVSQGGFIELAIGDEEVSGFLNGGFYLLDGRGVYDAPGVSDNRMGRAVTGFSWMLHNWDGHKVNWGVTLLGMTYAENQSGFTLGHGGYFSPELFVRGGVPLTWRYRHERWATLFEVDPGLNWFRQESADYYPTSAALQRDLEAVSSTTTYPERTSFGFSLNFGADVRYELGSNFDLGVRAAMHFADDYEEYRAGVFLQFNFRRQVQASGATQ